MTISEMIKKYELTLSCGLEGETGGIETKRCELIYDAAFRYYVEKYYEEIKRVLIARKYRPSYIKLESTTKENNLKETK